MRLFLFSIKSVGTLGEKIAKKYLKKKGYKILTTNFQNKRGKRLGEIDIVAKIRNDKKEWEFVFVEVKTRIVSETTEIFPEEMVNRRKLYKLQKIAHFYIKENDLWNFSYRFDVVSVLMTNNLKLQKIKHFKNVFL